MVTHILVPNDNNIDICAKAIRCGQVVAFPTETVYGLGGNAYDAQAVDKIYTAKGRPNDNPLIVHIASADHLLDVAREVPVLARKLADALMPGPLTIVLPKKESIPSVVTGGLDTVGVRIPSHPVARAFIEACGCPICAPSANTSGKPSPTLAEHVFDDLNGKIPYILDGGACSVGIESTIIDFCMPKPRLLRRGGVALEQIMNVIGEVDVYEGGNIALCPGMKYKHYSPVASVLFANYDECMHDRIVAEYDRLTELGKRVEIMCLTTGRYFYGSRHTLEVGCDYDAYAHNLFAFFRDADRRGIDVIICEGAPSMGIGASIVNRLVKAAGGTTI